MDHGNERAGAVNLTYLVFDTSGSTRRRGWLDECNRALRLVIETLEDEAREGPRQLVCLLTYGDSSEVRLPLEDVATVSWLPALVPSGFSSLAAALSLLGDVIAADLDQLTADAVVPLAPTVVLVADDLPTDRTEDLLDSWSALRAGGDSRPCLRVVHANESDHFAFRGMGFSRAVWAGDGYDRDIAAAILCCRRETPERTRST
jgi:uncharacterized protein YegL